MLTQARVLLVAEEGPDGLAIRHVLASVGHDVTLTHTIDDAARRLGQGESDAVVLLNQLDAPRALERLSAEPCASESVTFVVACRSGAMNQMPESIRLGASDVIDLAGGEEPLVIALERAVREAQLRRELSMLRARVGDAAQHALVGRSSAMAHVRELVGRAAATRATVVITGEPGAGKDAVARLIHDLSDRASRPFVTVQCDGADAAALELELFGCVATNSGRARAGLLEEARGGTVVLDDAAMLPAGLRALLARAVSTRTTQRVGGSAPLPADVRLILTARTAQSETADGSLEDLLTRFNAIPVTLPPLRERRSDIPQLVQHFRRRFATEQGIELAPLSPDEMLPLLAHEWTGNVRELEHWVERNALATTSERPGSGAGAMGSDLAGLDLGTARITLEQLERAYILHVLEQESGHQSRASVRLGIDRRTLYRKLKQYRTEGMELQQAG